MLRRKCSCDNCNYHWYKITPIAREFPCTFATLRPMSSPVRSYGVRQTKVTPAAVAQAADALFASGTPPTVRKVRERLGGGALGTLTPLLRAWWKELPTRFVRAATTFDRRAEVAHLLEALWLEALEEARIRARGAAASATAPLPSDRSTSVKARGAAPMLDTAPRVAQLEEDLTEFKRLWREECAHRRSADRQADRLRAELLRFVKATMKAPVPKGPTPAPSVTRAASVGKRVAPSARRTTRPAASRKPKSTRTD